MRGHANEDFLEAELGELSDGKFISYQAYEGGELDVPNRVRQPEQAY